MHDRGPDHLHRWVATCSCGWASIPLNLRSSAEKRWEIHRKGAEPPRRPNRVGPRKVTPNHQLPPELRRDEA